MFKSPEQAVSYFYTMAFLNRYAGELVVFSFTYIYNVAHIIRSF